jgi:hypothetical protein
MPKKIDLHCHTLASDGELSAEELIDLAVKKNLKAIAITDHDSLGSLKKAIDYSKGRNIKVVPGVEISCDDPLFNHDKIDVLGLFVDYNNKSLVNLTEQINKKRDLNKRKIIKKLNKLGFKIDFDEVKKTAKGTLGRPHIAKFLLRRYLKRFVSVKDVFDKYIGAGKPAFVKPEEFVPIKKAVKIINQSGGISILAHPGIYPKEDSIKLIDYFINNGGQGIETYYPYHLLYQDLNLDEKGNNGLIAYYKDIARSKNLLESGGCDYHGNYRPTLGRLNIPYRILENLRRRIPLS